MTAAPTPDKSMDHTMGSLNTTPSTPDTQDHVGPVTLATLATIIREETNAANGIETRDWALEPAKHNSEVGRTAPPKIGFTRPGPHTLFAIPERLKEQNSTPVAGMDGVSSPGT